MTVRELYAALCAAIPPALSAPWDNDGLLCTPDAGAAVGRVLCTLDVTDAVIDRAIEENCSVIVSHHPLIFRPVGALNGEDAVSRRTIRLLQEGISVFSFHTRADAVEGGVNTRLAALFGLTEVAPLPGEEGNMARIGSLPTPLPAADFARQVRDVLGAPFVLLADCGRPVKRVALCGGEGKDFLAAAAKAGADLYVSGRIGYHPMQDAADTGMSLLEAGHYYTEAHIAPYFAELVRGVAPGVEALAVASQGIRTI